MIWNLYLNLFENTLALDKTPIDQMFHVLKNSKAQRRARN